MCVCFYVCYLLHSVNVYKTYAEHILDRISPYRYLINVDTGRCCKCIAIGDKAIGHFYYTWIYGVGWRRQRMRGGGHEKADDTRGLLSPRKSSAGQYNPRPSHRVALHEKQLSIAHAPSLGRRGNNAPPSEPNEVRRFYGP